MTSPKLPRRTAGAVALQSSVLTQEELTARLGIDRTHLSRIGCGERMPTKTQRVLFAAELGIPLDAWERAPDLPPEPDPSAVPTFTDQAFREETQHLFGEVHHMRACAEFYRRQGNAKLHMSMTRAATAQLELLGRLSGATLEISEARAARLPAVRRILEKLATALQPWPEAYAAARDVFVGVGE